MDNVALIGIHRFKSHAALVLDDLCGHFLGKANERLLTLCTVALGIDGNVHMLVAAAVDHIIGQMLDSVECLASAAYHGAHVGARKVHNDALAVTGGYLNIRLGSHAL